MKTILGTISADILRGTAGNDTLFGGDGNDTLDGGLGADSMAGGKGNDIYYVDALSDEVIEEDSGGIDTVRLQLVGGGLEFLYKMSAHVENLEMLGTAGYYAWGNELDNVMTGNSGDNLLSGFGGNDTLSGGAGNDQLFGGDGNDSLDGGTGADTMAGGKGNDIYYVDALSDVVTEAAGEGIDTVRLSLTGADARPVYIMAANVENLQMQGTSELRVLGNELGNVITGNSGDNFINGLEGNDKIYGGKGVDVLLGGPGNDTLYGGDGRDHLHGERGADTIYGGNGDDHIMGDEGNDILTGGAGADIFVFNTLEGVDHITDFEHGQDQIWLEGGFEGIGSGTITAKNFSIHAGGHATRTSDRIIYDSSTGKLYYDADGSGHHYGAVLIAILDNHAHLTASDFQLG